MLLKLKHQTVGILWWSRRLIDYDMCRIYVDDVAFSSEVQRYPVDSGYCSSIENLINTRQIKYRARYQTFGELKLIVDCIPTACYYIYDREQNEQEI